MRDNLSSSIIDLRMKLKFNSKTVDNPIDPEILFLPPVRNLTPIYVISVGFHPLSLF